MTSPEEALTGKSGMPEPLRNGWNPIESAPFDEDVTLQVTDGHGEPYVLQKPSRLTADGWVSSGKGTPLAVKALQWRRYYHRALRSR
jgi:hypothetical protein